jgi:putative MATE family efflux protein
MGAVQASSSAPDMETDSPPRLIWRMALPAIIGLSANALYHTVNAMFLGRLGAEAVSAVSAVLPVLILLGAVGEGIAVGTASLASRLLGAKEQDAANRAATTGLAVAILTGIAVSIALAFHTGDVLRLFGVTESAFPLAEAYLRVALLGYVLLMLQIFGDFLAISEGNTRFSMWVLIAAFGINALLDPVFIFGFGWGVTGAAAATLLAQMTAAAVYLGYFIRGLGRLRIAPRFLTADGAILREIAAVGLPATLATSLTALAFALIYGTAAAYGDEAVAGIGIALRLFSLGALPVFGFCLGARPVLGFAWGAGDAQRVSAALRFMLTVSFTACAAYALVILAFAPQILALFTSDPDVIAVGVRAAYACFALFAFFGVHVGLVTFLQSTGQALLAGILLLAPQGYFLVPGLLVLPPLWGLDGILASQVIAAGLTAIASAFILMRQFASLRRRRTTGGLAGSALAG